MDSKRMHERVVITAPLFCYELDDQGVPLRGVKGKMVDLGRGGVGMQLQGMVHEGREVIVILRAGPGVRSFYGTVRHVSYKGGGHVVGLMFKPMPEEGDIAASVRRLESQTRFAA